MHPRMPGAQGFYGRSIDFCARLSYTEGREIVPPFLAIREVTMAKSNGKLGRGAKPELKKEER